MVSSDSCRVNTENQNSSLNTTTSNALESNFKQEHITVRGNRYFPLLKYKCILICVSLSFYWKPSPEETRFPSEIPSQELGICPLNPNFLLTRLNTSPNSGQQVTSMPEILELSQRNEASIYSHSSALRQKIHPVEQQSSNYRELTDMWDLMESPKESKEVNYTTKEISYRNKEALNLYAA